MHSGLNELKRQVFYGLLELAGRVFMLVEYADGVVIGTRGFLPEEKEKGIVLVFNSKMNFQWDGSGLSGKLVFGTTPQQCFIPAEAILSIFSPETSAQFSVSPEKSASQEFADAAPEEKPPSGNKIVKVDFQKKK
jgi:stringent starvation protein B